MNLANLMRQAQQVQKKLQDAQQDLAKTDVTGQSADGNVTVVCDGNGRFKSISLTKSAINPDNPNSVDDETVEMLIDTITLAMSKATSQANTLMQNKLKGIMPAGINIPGLF